MFFWGIYLLVCASCCWLFLHPPAGHEGAGGCPTSSRLARKPGMRRTSLCRSTQEAWGRLGAGQTSASSRENTQKYLSESSQPMAGLLPSWGGWARWAGGRKPADGGTTLQGRALGGTLDEFEWKKKKSFNMISPSTLLLEFFNYRY